MISGRQYQPQHKNPTIKSLLAGEVRLELGSVVAGKK